MIVVNDVHPLSCFLRWKLDWKQILLPSSCSLLGEFAFSPWWAVGPGSGWLSAGSICRPHAIHDNGKPPAVPPMWASSLWPVISASQQGESHSRLMRWGLTESNVTTGVTFLYLAIFYWLEVSHRSGPNSRGGDYTKAWKMGSGHHWGSLLGLATAETCKQVYL